MKSKFNLGERVYFLDKNKVTTGVILEIKIIAREIDLQSRLIRINSLSTSIINLREGYFSSKKFLMFLTKEV